MISTKHHILSNPFLRGRNIIASLGKRVVDGLIQDITIIVLEKLIFPIGENTDVLKKQHQDLRRNNEGDTEILSNNTQMPLTDLCHLT
jgi:hypothetical protein